VTVLISALIVTVQAHAKYEYLIKLCCVVLRCADSVAKGCTSFLSTATFGARLREGWVARGRKP